MTVWRIAGRSAKLSCGAALIVVAGSVLAAPLAAASARTNGRLTAVVVRGESSTCAATVSADVTALGGHMKRVISIIDGGSALVPASALRALAAAPCVAAVTADGALKLESIGGYDPTADAGSLYSTTQAIGAQQLWKNGVTGKGVGVALIDTGVAPVQGLNAPGQVFNGPDLSFDSQAPQLTQLDEYGHGTHLAGIIAGNDSYGTGTPLAGNSNQFTGVAPGSHIVNVKVGDENGVVDVSQVLAGIDWVVQHRSDNGVNIRVLNLSFGTDSVQPYQLDPLAFAAEVAWRSGIVVVASAGNAGSSSNGLTDPAFDPFVIAVGAADNGVATPSGQGNSVNNLVTSVVNGIVAGFSSNGDGVRNPDVVAPGVHMASLRDPGSYIDNTYGSTATVSTNTRFFRGSGTSQAAAVVSGAAALMLQAHPSSNPNQVKFALAATATQLTGQPATAQGHGEINVAAAAKMQLYSGEAAQSFTRSTGTGSLELARGSVHVVSNGVALTGEQDIFGNAFNSAAMAAAEASGASWSGGNWNGASWSGASWSGASWSGASWSGASWSGASWSGASWSGASWSGASWSGASWSGASWSGASWSGASWSGASWSGASWSGASWSGAGWADVSWS